MFVLLEKGENKIGSVDLLGACAGLFYNQNDAFPF